MSLYPFQFIKVYRLKRTAQGDRQIPLLHFDQVITKCQGGVVVKDSIGRQYFRKTVGPINIEIAVPCRHDIIDCASNYRGESPAMKMVQQFLESTHILFKSKDISCQQRTAVFMKQVFKDYPEMRGSFLIAENDTHSFILVRDGSRWVRVDLGGNSDYTKTYADESDLSTSPVSESEITTSKQKRFYLTITRILN